MQLYFTSFLHNRMTDKEPNEGLNTSARSLIPESDPEQENSASTPLDMLQIQQDLIAAFRLQAAEMMEEVRLVKEDILNHNAKTKGPFKKYVTVKIPIFDPPSPPCHRLSPFALTPLPPLSPPK